MLVSPTSHTSPPPSRAGVNLPEVLPSGNWTSTRVSEVRLKLEEARAIVLGIDRNGRRVETEVPLTRHQAAVRGSGPGSNCPTGQAGSPFLSHPRTPREVSRGVRPRSPCRPVPRNARASPYRTAPHGLRV